MTDSYPWIMTLGAITSLFWLGLVESPSKQSKQLSSPISRIDSGLVALVLGLIGARLIFVLMYWHYFTFHVDEILQFWNGGLSWVGGAIGALIALGIFAAIKGQSFWELIDILALPATIIGFCAWFGCLMDACSYGKEATLGLITPLAPDNLGEKLNRWPVQGSGAILTLGILLLISRMRASKLPSGLLGCLSLALISATNFLLSFFRGDQAGLMFLALILIMFVIKNSETL
jgi:phosphatidylglycerol:prolipoprotein diacylglycerol transferase